MIPQITLGMKDYIGKTYPLRSVISPNSIPVSWRNWFPVQFGRRISPDCDQWLVELSTITTGSFVLDFDRTPWMQPERWLGCGMCYLVDGNGWVPRLSAWDSLFSSAAPKESIRRWTNPCTREVPYDGRSDVVSYTNGGNRTVLRWQWRESGRIRLITNKNPHDKKQRRNKPALVEAINPGNQGAPWWCCFLYWAVWLVIYWGGISPVFVSCLNPLIPPQLYISCTSPHMYVLFLP